jgi:NAD(P)-dependent dehydrogenase (short-subunit alcohol dehydrogenase family)
MRLANKVAVVTGGCRGIGLATAQLFASEGARVIAVDIAEPPQNASLDFARVDVTRPEQVKTMLNQVGEQHGRLDILIANAGMPYQLTSLTATDAQWEECLALNLKSAWICVREAHPLLRSSAAASIVTVASAQALRSGRASFPYSAAKGGLLALTRTLAVEYAPHVRVNAVVPGQIESVRTEPYFNSFRDPEEARRRVLSTFPMGRLGRSEDVAKAILFLASDDASWITGSFLTVDGGRDAATLNLSDLETAK